MRITRASLIQAARQIADQRARKNRRLVCIYLSGSLISEEPLLGGTTDIDLFFIHDGEPLQRREILELSDELHIDIAHYPQSLFRQPREQRTDPWLAPFLCSNPLCLHDTQHWFEFTQASVCAQFSRPEYTLQRSRAFAEEARQIWFDLKTGIFPVDVEKVMGYLKSLERSANAIASLSTNPLTERRFLLAYPRCAEAIGRPGLAAGFSDLIMKEPVTDETWQTWLSDWEVAFSAAAAIEGSSGRLSPCRVNYYRSAANTMRSDHPAAALWPILRTWTLAMSTLPEENEHLQNWQAALQTLGLGQETFDESIRSLDAYLDSTEETIDLWAEKMGL